MRKRRDEESSDGSIDGGRGGSMGGGRGEIVAKKR